MVFMCGICGLVITDKSNIVNLNVLKKMTDSLIHRGPDEEGYFHQDFVGLGHRRLSIIDLSEGQQPIFNEDKSKVIIFNGEIYNYLELKKFLESKGHFFKTASDTEVILHLYEEFGPDCVLKLRGMFAFAIYDLKKEILFLSRDRLGIKPLYYYYHNSKFIFGSEIKAILEYPDINKDIDNTAFFDYLKYLYIPSPKSIFKYIKKLPAGYSLILKNGSYNISQYWDLTFEDNNELTENKHIEELTHILEESVRIRLMSEVPLGAFLSGGIDSSMVVAIMSRFNEKQVITNSVGFTFNEFNELPYARETSELFKTNHNEYIIEAHCSEILDKLTWYYDEPFADSSALPTYYVSKMARENVTVALSGDGGDENFAGYRRYYFDNLENRLRSIIPNSIRRTLINNLAHIYPKGDWLPQIFRAKTLLTNLALDPVEGYYNTMTHFSDKALRNIVNSDLHRELDNYSPFDIFYQHYQNAGTNDPLSKIQYLDIKTYLVDDILTKVDRASMANSLEVRVPVLDHIFMEYAAKIPSFLKLKGKNGKYIFKQLATNYLPHQVLNRKKMGFSIPIETWFRNELKAIFENEVIFNNNSYINQYFNLNTIKNMWKQHQRGIRNFGYQFWSIIWFEKWSRNFLKRRN